MFQCPQTELDFDTVKMILSEYKISNADITLRYDATSDDLIDVIEGNRVYIPCIYLLNKIGNCAMINIISVIIIRNIDNCEFFSRRSNKYRRTRYYL